MTTIKSAAKKSQELKDNDKSVGLVVGCFDIVHLGHLRLFEFARKRVDYLLVGLDTDEATRVTKGQDRPINSQQDRLKFLTHVQWVDHPFSLTHTSKHGSQESGQAYKLLLETIKPTHIFTSKNCDRHWKEKKAFAKELGIKAIIDQGPKITSSGAIINKISNE